LKLKVAKMKFSLFFVLFAAVFACVLAQDITEDTLNPVDPPSELEVDPADPPVLIEEPLDVETYPTEDVPPIYIYLPPVEAAEEPIEDPVPVEIANPSNSKLKCVPVGKPT
jgi:hypothetical protein